MLLFRYKTKNIKNEYLFDDMHYKPAVGVKNLSKNGVDFVISKRNRNSEKSVEHDWSWFK